VRIAYCNLKLAARLTETTHVRDLFLGQTNRAGGASYFAKVRYERARVLLAHQEAHLQL
jgi:hypothetical protein